MKKYVFLLFIVLFTFINIINMSPFIESKFFNITHPTWIEIHSFKILERDITCSRFSRGSDSFAKISVTYEYYKENRKYISTDNSVITIYKINVFDKCEKLKYEASKAWEKYYKEKKIQIWVDKNNIEKSKLLIIDKKISLRLSKISFYIAELQGVIYGLFSIVFFVAIYIISKLLKK